MSPSESYPGSSEGASVAVPLEISAELASEVDAQLRVFAEHAELETALVVHRSGSLVSGISSEEQVTIDVISALVAAASGAVEALIQQFGKSGEVESFHQGGEHTLYFRGIPGDFILVGVSSAQTPVGVIREGARQIVGPVLLLVDGIPVPTIAPPSTDPVSYVPIRPARPEPEPEPIPEPEALDEEVAEPESAMAEEEAEEEAEEAEAPPVAVEEPREVLESLDGGEPEVVIEGEEQPIYSPFEAEEEPEEEPSAEEPPNLPTDSIFEAIEDEEDEAPEEELEGVSLNEIFEIDEGEPEPPTDDADASDPFELVEDEDEELEDESEEDFLPAGSTDAAGDAGAEEPEEEATAEEEEEVPSTGPFYL